MRLLGNATIIYHFNICKYHILVKQNTHNETLLVFISPYYMSAHLKYMQLDFVTFY